MPETDIRPRPDIVALLSDTDFKRRRDTRAWSHRDGRPFSKEEQAFALRATRGEFEELSAQLGRYTEYKHTKDESPEAFQRFLAPFMEQLTQKKLGNAVQLMTEDERTEFDRLLGLVIEPILPFCAYAFRRRSTSLHDRREETTGSRDLTQRHCGVPKRGLLSPTT
ncbi:hypothetical protein [Streptomyces sp. MUSC 14]|uniref:hypothetical protein n=1 Tax=Streptomyces sp. MUSC 14 TaxID=1354889 RepID=UPI000AF24CFF|nr:hypothetical protein [Streptomyces sp. MUSC 14]